MFWDITKSSKFEFEKKDSIMYDEIMHAFLSLLKYVCDREVS